MKGKVFQYGLVYGLAMLMNAVIAFFYISYFYSILITPNIDYTDSIYIVLIALIALFSPVALFFLIRKHRLAVLMQSVLLILVIINILSALLVDVFFKESDYFISYAVYFLLFGVWLIIIRKYRFKGDKVYWQIENIGKHED